MEKARELRQEELQSNPLLRELLELARAGREQAISYQGVTVVLQPVEDITHTFSPEEREQFAAAYKAAEEPGNRLTAAEAIARFRSKNTPENG